MNGAFGIPDGAGSALRDCDVDGGVAPRTGDEAAADEDAAEEGAASAGEVGGRELLGPDVEASPI